VLIGELIPAGTGMTRYRSVEIAPTGTGVLDAGSELLAELRNAPDKVPAPKPEAASAEDAQGEENEEELEAIEDTEIEDTEIEDDEIEQFDEVEENDAEVVEA